MDYGSKRAESLWSIWVRRLVIELVRVPDRQPRGGSDTELPPAPWAPRMHKAHKFWFRRVAGLIRHSSLCISLGRVWVSENLDTWTYNLAGKMMISGVRAEVIVERP